MRWLKSSLIALSALLVTTLGISASDVLNNHAGSLLGQLAGSKTEAPCPTGMIHIPTAATFTCVDQFENSVAPSCPIINPVSNQDTIQNINDRSCLAVSTAGAQPWTVVTREQAQALCLREGKRLPTAAEWYFVAIGTPDTPSDCNINSNTYLPTGQKTSCLSSFGLNDTIGNVWEWVSDDVIDGQYQGRPLPAEGYVTQVASDGMPTATAREGSALFGQDYFWSDPVGAYGLLRGGYFGSGQDGGLYSSHAKTPPTLATAAIGFRCVK